MAMVKANAYGHGLDIVSKVLQNQVDYFGVNTIQEAQTIRQLGINTPILITGPIDIGDINLVLKNNVDICAHSIEYLQSLVSYPIRIHLKINTGMNRLGINPQELKTAITIIKNSKIIPMGIYTHFHSADSKSMSTKKQLTKFKECVTVFKSAFPNSMAHCANTSATLTHPDSHLDMVRVGLGLYGLWPSKFVKNKSQIKLEPILKWITKIVQKRILTQGESVGYSATYIAKNNIDTAIVPVGYSDGLDRRLSSKAHFIGRVAMNFSAIDINKSKGVINDDGYFEIIGPAFSADKIAELIDTINYEVTTRLNNNIRRILA